MTLFAPSAGRNGRSRRLARWMALSAAVALTAPLAGQTPAAKPPAAPAKPAARAAAVSAQGTGGYQPATDFADLDAIYRIKEEGLSNSKVMNTLSYLTDVHGPRLTNSPGMRAAAEWARTQLTEWGLSNVHFETWGPFGRGWANDRFHAQMIEPQGFPLLAFSKAWTPGTNGPLTAEAVMVSIEKEEDFAKYEGKLSGKIVMASPLREFKSYFDSPVRRFSDKELDDMAKQPAAGAGGRRFGPGGPGGFGDAATAFRRKRMEFYVKQGVAAVFEMSAATRGDNGAVVVAAFAQGEGSREVNGPTVVPQVVVSAEHYGRLARLLDKKIPVKIALDIKSRYVDTDLNSYNVIAEIPGSDKKDEVVMIGAHFDSWHSGTGATDNGVSSAVMMEALRILKATGLQPRRTIRMGLWTGEEQGLLGSRAYVKEHFGDRETMALKPEHAKLSLYLNMDNGGGVFRGVYLQGNEAIAPIFEAWMKPFANMGMTTNTIRNTSGTDHLSFDAVGLPGFQFIQDPIEYSSRTHHTNLDVYERAIPDDLMQNAVIVASFAYQAANRETLMPRKPLPKPQPAARPAGAPAPTGTSAAAH
jgi:carboxypeptidase Q